MKLKLSGELNTVIQNKEPLFFLHSVSLLAALRITSYGERNRARKVNPVLDQSGAVFKKDFSSTGSRTCEVCAHGQ